MSADVTLDLLETVNPVPHPDRLGIDDATLLGAIDRTARTISVQAERRATRRLPDFEGSGWRHRRRPLLVAAASFIVVLLAVALAGILLRIAADPTTPVATTAPPATTSPVTTSIPPDTQNDVFPPESAAYGVAASDSIVVAVGSDLAYCCGTGVDGNARDGSSATVWTSFDGVVWTRVPHDESVFGGPDGQIMHSVAATPFGFVAGGMDRAGAGMEPGKVALWTSPDGLTWSRVPDENLEDAETSRRNSESIEAVVYWDDRAYAFGFGDGWISTDGVRWSRSEPGIQHQAVIATPSGLRFDPNVRGVISFGGDYLGLGTEDGDYGLWRSTDGTEWVRDDSVGASIEPGAIVTGITEFDGFLIGVGIGGQGSNYQAMAQPILTGDTVQVRKPPSITGLISPNRWSIAVVMGEASAAEVEGIVEEYSVRDGVVDVVQVSSDWSVWNAVTGLEEVCLPGWRCGDGFVILVEDDQLGPVREELEARFGSYPSDVIMADVVFRGVVNEYVAEISGPNAHPDPAFDTLALGVEQALIGPLDPDTVPLDVFIDPGEHAWVGVARQPATDITAAWWMDSSADDLGIRLEVGGGGLGQPPPLPFLVLAARSPDQSTVAIGGLPPETSVVAVALNDGTTVWQRPVSGMVVLDTRPGVNGRFRVLDALGLEILGVDEVRPDDYRVVTPVPRAD